MSFHSYNTVKEEQLKVSQFSVCPQNVGNFCVALYINYPEVLSDTQRRLFFESTGYCQNNIRKSEYKISGNKFNFFFKKKLF